MATGANRHRLNTGWVFHDHYAPGDEQAYRPGIAVRLPHNAVDLPLNYFDETTYQRAFLYQHRLHWQDEFEDREIALCFDGAMADAEVFLNGEKIASHRDGYTPFVARLTEGLLKGDNVISVKVDGSENPEIPPFGGQIDYLTYAGIYRDVWLRVAPKVSLGNIKVECLDVLNDTKSVHISAEIDNPRGIENHGKVRFALLDTDGTELGVAEAGIHANKAAATIADLEGIALWELDEPHLYRLRTTLISRGYTDQKETAFGFRSAEFKEDGFYLNGDRLHLRGLNRHQSYPYVGYAMGRRAQERDAEILKHELKCNVVRTSHYPQSPWFLDRCDRIGLLVIEEIPGWQHIGGAAWKDESVANVGRMIRRDWNHPSIIMWGVRINESADDHVFYNKTNALARDIDPTRATGGIRCIEDSELLEDVYTMNDFFHAADENFRGNRAPAPLRTRAEVTGSPDPVPYLVTEFNGHMFPTKRTDSELRQAEHVMRYLQVLDRAYGAPGISGTVGWCMFDYNTHKDFGSGDRICHHGVLDMFRIPKFAASVYASQGDPRQKPVLEPVTIWARGERDIGGVLPLIVLTNCDYVDVAFGDLKPQRVHPDRDSFPHLPFAPVIIDERSVKPEDIGAWGMKWEAGSFTGYLDDEPVITKRFAGDPVPTALDVRPDDTTISAAEPDELRVVIRALDQMGNAMPYLDDVIYLEVDGPASLIGPDVLPLKGGAAGFWVRANGTPGTIELRVFSQRLGTQTVSITAV